MRLENRSRTGSDSQMSEPVYSALRKMRDILQEVLAEKAHMSRSTLSAIEAPNLLRPFSVELLFNIADALEIRPGDLLNSSMFSDEMINRK